MLRARCGLHVGCLLASTVIACATPTEPREPSAAELRYAALASAPEWSLGAERDSAFNSQLYGRREWSAFRAGGWRVARTPERWTTLWDTIVGYSWPVPAPPAVDHSTEMVVVAAHGPWSNTGKGISIEHVTRQRDTTFVLVQITSYTDCYHGSAETSPIDARVVPLAPPPTWFLVEQVVYSCTTRSSRSVW